jgi:hypothetical protein
MTWIDQERLTLVLVLFAFVGLAAGLVLGCALSRRLLNRHGTRARLPNHRAARTFKFDHSGFRWHATVNVGEPLELFLSTAKTGELLEWLSKDMAIAASLALQYGCPLGVLRAALARDTGGEPLTPLAMALDIASKGDAS